MKKIISAIAFIVFAIVLPIHLVTDDPLDPEAQKWIEHYSTEPNLDNNAFIALIALGYDTVDSYQRATKEYLDYVERLNNTLDIYENILEYPRIVNLPTSVIDDKYCTMGEEGCFEKLETNKSEIGEDLTTSEDVLTKFLAISDYENFQPINATITEPSLEVLIKLVKLTGIQIYYQIQEGNVNRAVEMLEKLARIERFFFQSNLEVNFDFLLLFHYESVYIPLVKKLLEINFQHWEKLSVLLSNIDINFMSMNHDWLQQFNNTVITMKHISKSLESLEDRSFFSIYLSKLKFKESMTINESFEHAKQLLIPKGIYKKDFIHEFEKTKNQEKVLDKLLKSEAENLYLTSIKNYKNVVGHNLLIIARPLIIDLTKDKIELDLKISLLRLLISSKNDSINDVIKRKEYINSYTGEAPIIENDLVCYEVFSKVCLSTKLDSVL